MLIIHHEIKNKEAKSAFSKKNAQTKQIRGVLKR